MKTIQEFLDAPERLIALFDEPRMQPSSGFAIKLCPFEQWKCAGCLIGALALHFEERYPEWVVDRGETIDDIAGEVDWYSENILLNRGFDMQYICGLVNGFDRAMGGDLSLWGKMDIEILGFEHGKQAAIIIKAWAEEQEDA